VDLVLNARLAMLRSSLMTVQAAVSHLKETRRPSAVLTGFEDEVKRLSAAIDEAVRLLREQKLDLEALRVVNRLEEAPLAKNPNEIVGPQLVSLGTSVDNDLREDVQERLGELTAIEEKLVRADKGSDAQLADEAWRDFARATERCEGVFAEYVDLVRGVVLRDAGLDRDLCRIADELVRIWGRFRNYEWQSFTIPASRERNGMSAARLIRLGFPEWSVWSLALTAYEFGHVFAAQHNRMLEIARVSSQDGRVEESAVRCWIADSFATAVMGPAYVCAAMLLRASPSIAGDHARVEVMLRSLDTLDENGEHETERDRLRNAWEEAASHAPHADVTPVADLIDSVVSEVSGLVREPFTPSAWGRAVAWGDKLGENLSDPDTDMPKRLAEQLAPEDDLRILLVAAWYARLGLSNAEQPRPGKGEVHQDRVRRLAERTRLTCVERIDSISPTAATSGISQPPRWGDSGPPSGGPSGPDKPPPPTPRDTE